MSIEERLAELVEVIGKSVEETRKLRESIDAVAGVYRMAAEASREAAAAMASVGGTAAAEPAEPVEPAEEPTPKKQTAKKTTKKTAAKKTTKKAAAKKTAAEEAKTAAPKANEVDDAAPVDPEDVAADLTMDEIQEMFGDWLESGKVKEEDIEARVDLVFGIMQEKFGVDDLMSLEPAQALEVLEEAKERDPAKKSSGKASLLRRKKG